MFQVGTVLAQEKLEMTRIRRTANYYTYENCILVGYNPELCSSHFVSGGSLNSRILLTFGNSFLHAGDTTQDHNLHHWILGC
jgi:hypothetical protein